jgi:hypothetical protein
MLSAFYSDHISEILVAKQNRLNSENNQLLLSLYLGPKSDNFTIVPPIHKSLSYFCKVISRYYNIIIAF